MLPQNRDWSKQAKAAHVVFIVIGIVYLALGFFIFFVPDAELDNMRPRANLGIIHIYFFVTCLLFAFVFRLLTQIKKEIVQGRTSTTD
jgi:Na+/phosphate symporter